jgi:hypothetical protein
MTIRNAICKLSSLTARSVSNDNSYHAVTSTGLDKTAVLDGVTDVAHLPPGAVNS